MDLLSYIGSTSDPCHNLERSGIEALDSLRRDDLIKVNQKMTPR